MPEEIRKLEEKDFKQGESSEQKKEFDFSEEDNLLEKRDLHRMRKWLFWTIVVWSMISFLVFLNILFCNNNLYNLISLSHYSIFIIALLVVIPALMLSYLTCSVFRVQSGTNENAIVSLFSRLVRVWKSH